MQETWDTATGNVYRYSSHNWGDNKVNVYNQKETPNDLIFFFIIFLYHLIHAPL